MPKIITLREKLNRKAQAELDKWMKLKGIDKTLFGDALGVSQATGYRIYKDPSRLTIEELRTMHLSDEQILEMVR